MAVTPPGVILNLTNYYYIRFMYGVELPITLQQPDLLTILVVLIPILIMAIFLWKIETIFPVKPIEDKL